MTPTLAGRHDSLGSIGHLICLTPPLRYLIAACTVPYGQPWRIRCPQCATPLWPTACRPAGRCKACHEPTGAPAYTVEAAALATLVLLVWSGTRGWQLVGYTTWAMLMIVLGFIDAKAGRLPHSLSITATLALVGSLAFDGATTVTWSTAIAAAAGAAGFHAALHLLAPAGLGPGDVTIMVPIGFALGWLDWRYAVAVVFLAHATALLAFTLARRAGRARRHQPLGTYLAAISICLTVAARAIH